MERRADSSVNYTLTPAGVHTTNQMALSSEDDALVRLDEVLEGRPGT